jgi:translation initiation factor IF-3
MSKKASSQINEINSARVFLITKDGEKHGIISTDDARAMAENDQMDLVKVGMQDSIPVCKIMDLGKQAYDKKKQKRSAAKPKKIKQIEIRPNIEMADLIVKKNHIIQFLKDGHKVKVVMKYKGREMTHLNIGTEKIEYILNNLENSGSAESRPIIEGRNQFTILAPK